MTTVSGGAEINNESEPLLTANVPNTVRSASVDGESVQLINPPTGVNNALTPMCGRNRARKYNVSARGYARFYVRFSEVSA